MFVLQEILVMCLWLGFRGQDDVEARMMTGTMNMNSDDDHTVSDQSKPQTSVLIITSERMIPTDQILTNESLSSKSTPSHSLNYLPELQNKRPLNSRNQESISQHGQNSPVTEMKRLNAKEMDELIMKFKPSIPSSNISTLLAENHKEGTGAARDREFVDFNQPQMGLLQRVLQAAKSLESDLQSPNVNAIFPLENPKESSRNKHLNDIANFPTKDAYGFTVKEIMGAGSDEANDVVMESNAEKEKNMFIHRCGGSSEDEDVIIIDLSDIRFLDEHGDTFTQIGQSKTPVNETESFDQEKSAKDTDLARSSKVLPKTVPGILLSPSKINENDKKKNAIKQSGTFDLFKIHELENARSSDDPGPNPWIETNSDDSRDNDALVDILKPQHNTLPNTFDQLASALIPHIAKVFPSIPNSFPRTHWPSYSDLSNVNLDQAGLSMSSPFKSRKLAKPQPQFQAMADNPSPTMLTNMRKVNKMMEDLIKDMAMEESGLTADLPSFQKINNLITNLFHAMDGSLFSSRRSKLKKQSTLNSMWLSWPWNMFKIFPIAAGKVSKAQTGTGASSKSAPSGHHILKIDVVSGAEKPLVSKDLPSFPESSSNAKMSSSPENVRESSLSAEDSSSIKLSNFSDQQGKLLKLTVANNPNKFLDNFMLEPSQQHQSSIPSGFDHAKPLNTQTIKVVVDSSIPAPRNKTQDQKNGEPGNRLPPALSIETDIIQDKKPEFETVTVKHTDNMDTLLSLMQAPNEQYHGHNSKATDELQVTNLLKGLAKNNGDLIQEFKTGKQHSAGRIFDVFGMPVNVQPKTDAGMLSPQLTIIPQILDTQTISWSVLSEAKVKEGSTLGDSRTKSGQNKRRRVWPDDIVLVNG